MQLPKEHVIIFDGDCLLCNKFVRIIINLDKYGKFGFTSSQSSYFNNHFSHLNITDADKTVYLVSDNVLYSKSDAVLRILAHLPVPYKYLRGLRLFPKWLRDKIYDIISANRKVLFGRKNYCELFNEDQKSRILE